MFNNLGGTNIGTWLMGTPSGVTGGTFQIGYAGQSPYAFNITTSGNVGIGTSSPNFTLDINGTSRITTSLTTGALYSTNLTSSNIKGTNITISNGLTSIFNSNTLGNIYTTGGNVGIYTTTPTSQLDVNGNLNVNGYLTSSVYTAYSYSRLSSMSAAAATLTPIIWDNVIYDNTSAMNTSNGTWTCPINGFWVISVNITLSGSSNFGTVNGNYLAINGTAANKTLYPSGSSGNFVSMPNVYGTFLTSGDTVITNVNTSSTISGNWTIQAGTFGTNLTIYRIPN